MARLCFGSRLFRGHAGAVRQDFVINIPTPFMGTGVADFDFGGGICVSGPGFARVPDVEYVSKRAGNPVERGQRKFQAQAFGCLESGPCSATRTKHIVIRHVHGKTKGNTGRTTHQQVNECGSKLNRRGQTASFHLPGQPILEFRFFEPQPTHQQVNELALAPLGLATKDRSF